MAIKILHAANIATGKWSYLAFSGPAGWFDQDGNRTEVKKVTGSNCRWHGKVMRSIGTTILVVGIKCTGRTLKKDTVPTDGTVTVELTNVTQNPPPTTVQYADDADPLTRPE